MPRLEVLVPVKPLTEAKSRLAHAVSEARRQALTLLLLHNVISAVCKAIEPVACTVVGGDATMRHLLQDQHGCQWMDEPANDLNSSVWAAMRTSFDRGAVATLFLPADLPQASSGDIRAVVAASEGLRRPVGVPARQDGGTNALLVPSSLAFPPQLGRGSYALHAAAAQRLGVPLVTAAAPGLSVDMDTPEDLNWAVAELDSFAHDLGTLEAWVQRHLNPNIPTTIGTQAIGH